MVPGTAERCCCVPRVLCCKGEALYDEQLRIDSAWLSEQCRTADCAPGTMPLGPRGTRIVTATKP